MGRNSSLLAQDLYEYDYAEDYVDLPEPVATNKAERELRKSAEKLSRKNEKASKRESKSLDRNQDKSFANWEGISQVPVQCKCNKCGESVNATLLAFFYQPHTELYIPFVEYSCRQCYHVGRRSVCSAGLPLAKFEKTYFS